MAMRQRSGGVTATLPRQSALPVHEDFQPKSERKEEAAATVIVIHLPGFVKERVKITFVQSARILRVNGERPIQDNRWSRFNEAFPVPENCVVDNIEARFYQGILTITMPKIISQLRPAEEAKTIQNPTSTPNSASDQPKPQEVAEKIPPPKPTSAKTAPQKAPSPPKLVTEPKLQKGLEEILPKYTSPPKSAADPKTQTVQEHIPSTSGVEKQRDEKATTEPKVQKGAGDVPSTSIDERQRAAWSSQKATTEPKAQKGQDATPPKAASTTDTQKKMDTDQKSREKKDKLVEENGKDKETTEFEKVAERNMAKGKEAVQKIAESVMAEKTFVKNILEKKKESAETGIRQKVKNLTNKKLNDEEKQSLINVGAAVLVIVALGFGAYASYRYSSSGKPEK